MHIFIGVYTIVVQPFYFIEIYENERIISIQITVLQRLEYIQLKYHIILNHYYTYITYT